MQRQTVLLSLMFLWPAMTATWVLPSATTCFVRPPFLFRALPSPVCPASRSSSVVALCGGKSQLGTSRCSNVRGNNNRMVLAIQSLIPNFMSAPRAVQNIVRMSLSTMTSASASNASSGTSNATVSSPPLPKKKLRGSKAEDGIASQPAVSRRRTGKNVSAH